MVVREMGQRERKLTDWKQISLNLRFIYKNNLYGGGR